MTKKKLHNQCKYLAINNEEPYEKGAGHGPKIIVHTKPDNIQVCNISTNV